jgi:lysophospholipase L1-like esterase
MPSRPTLPYLMIAACLLCSCSALAELPLKFQFGARGNVRVQDTYDAARGYGFEPAEGDAPWTRFSVRLPEGNYRVTVRLGASDRASTTSVAAETRRLMLENVSTARGEIIERSFIVNVRNVSLAKPPANAPGGVAVRLKDRELGTFTWDDKLTLQFIGRDRAVAALSIAPVEVPVLYLAGDSTVTDQAASPAASWGQILPRFMRDTIAVANHAESGETLKSFLTSLRLDKILASLQPGDWLLIQFGHNDQKRQWPQTFADADTTYRAYLRAYIAEARLRGATPILVTSPERGNFDEAGHIKPSHGAYPDAVREVARQESVALIDLNAMSTTFYEALGTNDSGLAFAEGGRDRTHHSNYGAYELARRIAMGIHAADPKLIAHLGDHLAPDARITKLPQVNTPQRFSDDSL